MYEKWLRSFHAVAKHHGFTAGAHQLGVSQPTVTEQVRALETHFRVELFHRRGRRVELSSAGRTLYQITQDVFAVNDEALRFLHAARDLKVGRLSVGTVGPAVTMELVQRFATRLPGVEVTVDVGSAELVTESLDGFSSDVAVLARRLPESRYRSVLVGQFDVMAFANDEHPWARRRAVHVKDFSGQRVVFREPSSATQQVVDQALGEAGVSPGHILRVTGREGVREAVLRGLGVGVVCIVDYVPDSRLHMIRIDGASMTIPFFATCVAQRQNRPLIRRFMEVAEDIQAEWRQALRPRRKR
jgi:aminoethylphosphonate catabolism LysR family transcriptional regulator